MYILTHFTDTDDRPRILENFERPYLGNGSSDPLRVSRVGFSGWRIKCLYFRLDQIQDHGRQPYCIIFNGHISETVHPVLFVFGSKVKV